jgi:hypothetical protein
MRIKGGPELRARLQNIVASAAELERAWARDAASKIKADAPRRTGALAGSVQEGTSKGKGAVYGNWYGIIQDRGTKSYPISAKGSGMLRFEYKGRTIFAKKVQRKRLRRRPFITRGAQDALRSPALTAVIMKAWSRRSGKGRFSTMT